MTKQLWILGCRSLPVYRCLTSLILGIKFQQDLAQKQKQDELFLKWLSPSYWLVEGQFSSVRKQRGKDTLQWACNMPEFRNWRLSEMNYESNERILWIRGTLGVGKTIMAGYFIELLKCLHPDAIVAYFFCRSGQAGLTKPRDIIRTLAYQCIVEDKNVRSVVESLRTKDFCIDDDVAVGFLFEKLIHEPLNRTNKGVFIIIDGIDEVDSTIFDVAERHQSRPEIEVLIKCLGSLPFRVLFISRPVSDITRIIPNSIVKTLTSRDNMRDIDAYIKATIDGSARLRVQFQNEKIDAFKYFHEKANGIFLWVVIVLHQLSQTKSNSTFKRYLSEFSDASGDMWDLYSGILSKIQGEDKRWIQAILKWLIVAQNELTLNCLQEMVEYELQDKLADFRSFLEIECGALISLVPDSHDNNTVVRLIHETLRSFLINSELCPLQFHVEEKSAHNYATHVCLDIMSNNDAGSTSFLNYANHRWLNHLKLCNGFVHKPLSVLISLHRFFFSQGCKTWVRDSDFLDFPINTSDILSWLAVWKLLPIWHYLKEIETFEHESIHYDSVADTTMLAAIAWQKEVMEAPEKLARYITKCAHELWLYDELPWAKIPNAFQLALRYYCEINNWRRDGVEDLQDLPMQDFVIVSGIDEDPSRTIKNRNIGIGYYILRLWTEAIACFKCEEMVSRDDQVLRMYLGNACWEIGDYDGAIEALESVVDDVTYDHAILVLQSISIERLASAHRAKGNTRRMVDVLRKCFDKTISALHIVEANAISGNSSRHVVLPAEFRAYPAPWWFRQCFQEDLNLNSISEGEVADPREPELIHGICEAHPSSGIL